MPPRKRARVSQAASPSPASQPKTPTPAATSSPAKDAEDDAQNDAWTEGEEVGLFKALIRLKPTGIHKHFRLLAVHQYLLGNGYIHPRNEHTKPAGIWRKLQTLYDLEALDEREDARQLSDLSIESGDDEDDEEDVYSEAANKIHNEDFSLPEEDYAELKWLQRLASAKDNKDKSPAALPELNLADEPPVRFTPSFSVEPSEAATPSGRAKRGRPARGRGRAGPAALATDARRRSARKAESVAEEEEQAEEESGGEEGEEEESGEEDEDEDSEESRESKESTPARSTRASRSTRGRGGPRGRGRGRGRGK